MIKPDRETVVKLWTDALRSGEYKQCAGKLSDGVGYCCLGVLCEVARKNGLELNVLKEYESEFGEGDPGDDIHVKYDEEWKVLPTKVKDWAGLRYADGSFDSDDNLAGLNDNYTSFKEIANIIKFNVNYLFEAEDGPQN